jgi:Uma2 family endonuclease
METEDTEDYELVGGELVPLPSHTPRHSRIQGLLVRLLGNYFRFKPNRRSARGK